MKSVLYKISGRMTA